MSRDIEVCICWKCARTSYENTYCPTCNKLLIERYGFSITKYNISSDKHCPCCGEEIPIIGKPYVPSHEGW